MPATGYKKRRSRWTEEQVIEKIRLWVATYGDIPAATDWNGSDTRRAAHRSTARAHAWLERYNRFSAGEWPWTGTVFKLFGGWNEAIKAAGFNPRPAYRNGENMELGEVTPSTLTSLARSVERMQDPEARKARLHQLASAALQLALKED